MLSWFEHVLAQWTDRAKWPYIEARLEERFSTGAIPVKLDKSVEYLDNEMVDDIFTYVIGGKVYTAAIQEIAGHGMTAEKIGRQIRIQYNPARPNHIYYQPSCVLAGRSVGVLAVSAAAIAIACSVYIHTR